MNRHGDLLQNRGADQLVWRECLLAQLLELPNAVVNGPVLRPKPQGNDPPGTRECQLILGTRDDGMDSESSSIGPGTDNQVEEVLDGQVWSEHLLNSVENL